MIPFDASGDFHAPAEGRELKRRAVRAAAATVSAQWLGLVFQIGGTVALARLLTPADFGVVAMAVTFFLLLKSFGSNGFHEVVIQREGIDRYQASNLFWITFMVGVILMFGFAAAASLLARFYRNPLVANIAVALSVAIFISAISEIHIALLKRGMRFSAISANEVVGRIVYTGVAIVLALRGWGYWALVAALITHAFSITFGAWWLCRWIPSWPRRGVGTRAMLAFASNVFGRFTANYFSRNFDTLLIGWQFNAAALGLYKRAYDLFALWESQLTSPIHSVALAALSRMTHDPVRFKRYLANSLGIIALVGMAVGADLTLVGSDVVRLAFGPKWSESGRIFQLFGPGIGVMLLYSVVGWIHLSIGNPGRWLRWTIIESAFTILLFLLSLPFGPIGLAAAWSASFWILLIPAFWYAGRPIDFGVSSFISAVWRYVAAAITASLATIAIIRGTSFWTSSPDARAALVTTVVVSSVFVSLYLGAVILFHRGLGPLQQVAKLVRDLAPAARADNPTVESV